MSARWRAHFKFAPNCAARPTLLPGRRGSRTGRRVGPTPATRAVGRVPSATHSRTNVGKSGARSPHSKRLIAARSTGVARDSCTWVNPASKRARRKFSPNARICSTISCCSVSATASSFTADYKRATEQTQQSPRRSPTSSLVARRWGLPVGGGCLWVGLPGLGRLDQRNACLWLGPPGPAECVPMARVAWTSGMRACGRGRLTLPSRSRASASTSAEERSQRDLLRERG